MRQPLVSRRFGRGADRIPVGRPPGSPALDRLAESGGGPGRIAPLAPVALAALLALALDEERERAEPTPIAQDRPTRIAWVEWPDPVAPDRSPAKPAGPEPTSRRDPEKTHGSDSPPAPADALAAKQASPDQTARPTLDVASLLTAAPRVGAVDLSAAAPAARTARPIAQPADARSLRPAGLDVPRSTVATEGPANPMGNPSATPRNLAGARPEARGGDASAPAAAREAIAAADGRADFLAELDAAAASGRRLAPPAALPPVAAMTPDAEIGRRVRDDVAREARAAGWHEVPLDDLPDCSPPGRQDRLKQRIMRASAKHPTCRHAAGAYRFVETRNLNAFLMWSRTHPDVDAGSSGVRDACEVLARALECLTSSSTKELETR